MTTTYLLSRIAVMALVTYLIRMLPFVLVRGKIENRFVRSFLYYIPYTVLAAMVLPDMLFATSCIWSALVGLVVAAVLALWGKKLITVALCACGSVYIAELILGLFL
ncbi:MAG: AzlD domain-containing protein [Clostridia bacterium]|nr:AzlD domain-containing protein [Clostridia bacterium]